MYANEIIPETCSSTVYAGRILEPLHQYRGWLKSRWQKHWLQFNIFQALKEMMPIHIHLHGEKVQNILSRRKKQVIDCM